MSQKENLKEGSICFYGTLQETIDSTRYGSDNSDDDIHSRVKNRPIYNIVGTFGDEGLSVKGNLLRYHVSHYIINLN